MEWYELLLAVLGLTGLTLYGILRFLYSRNRWVRGFWYNATNKSFHTELKSISQYEKDFSIDIHQLKKTITDQFKVSKVYGIGKNSVDILFDDIHTPIRILIVKQPIFLSEKEERLGTQLTIELMGREEIGFRKIIKHPIFSRFESIISSIESMNKEMPVYRNNICTFKSIIESETWENNISKHDSELNLNVDITKNVLALNTEHFSSLVSGAKKYIPTPIHG